MKKASAFLGALLLSSAFMAPVSASETEDYLYDERGTMPEPETIMSGTLSSFMITQMKFTVPIKMEFAVAPKSTMLTDDAPAEANRLFIGDYKIKVAADSDVAIQIVAIKTSEIGNWTLASRGIVAGLSLNKTESLAAPEKAKTVTLSALDGRSLFIGNQGIVDGTFTVPIGEEKSLGYFGSAGKVWLDKNLGSGTQEQAFKVRFTVYEY